MPRPKRQRRGGLVSRLFEPVDAASLVVFRLAFGLLMLVEVWRFVHHGLVTSYYIEPSFHFTYWGFGWVRPWPGDGMYIHFGVLGLLAGLMAVGLFYRLSAVLFFLGFTYIFLLERANYLNHFYLICLVSFLMIFISPHRAFAVDAWRRPGWRSDTLPAWQLWLMQFQIGIAYFFGGIAKLNADWLRCEPLRTWLARRTDFPLIGPYFTNEFVVHLFSYGGLLLDLLVVPALLWRRTRLYAFGFAVFFHLMNARLFQIGIFPWFMLAATLLFFPPDWPRTLARRLGFQRLGQLPAGSEIAVPFDWRRRLTITCLAVYVAVQVLLPLRHWLYPGDVSWTEEGHNFSWHMKLRSKEARVTFFVTDPKTPRTWEVRPAEHLSSRQLRKMSTRPDLILQFAHHLADQYRARGYESVEVRAAVLCSLNGREPQLLIDPEANLAAQREWIATAPWILPLKEPLPDRVRIARDREGGWSESFD